MLGGNGEDPSLECSLCELWTPCTMLERTGEVLSGNAVFHQKQQNHQTSKLVWTHSSYRCTTLYKTKNDESLILELSNQWAVSLSRVLFNCICLKRKHLHQDRQKETTNKWMCSSFHLEDWRLRSRLSYKSGWAKKWNGTLFHPNPISILTDDMAADYSKG